MSGIFYSDRIKAGYLRYSMLLKFTNLRTENHQLYLLKAIIGDLGGNSKKLMQGRIIKCPLISVVYEINF